MQSRRLSLRYFSYRIIVKEKRNPLVRASHRRQQRGTDALSAVGYSPIGESINTPTIRHRFYHFVPLLVPVHIITIRLFCFIKIRKSVPFKRYLLWKLKPETQIIVKKTNHIDSVSLLRYAVIACIHNFILRTISEFRHRIVNSQKSLSLVVFNEVGNIFKKNHPRFFCCNNPCRFKKQVSSRILKAFLQSNRRKRLARKTGN